MRPGRAAGRAKPADGLAGLDVFADLDVDFREMSVTGREPIAMIDFDHTAIAAAPAGGNHGSGRRYMDRFSGVAAEIEAGMHRGPSDEGIDAHAEPRGGVDLAVHRFAQRHGRERRT